MKLSKTLNGQWHGQYSGTNSGRIVVDLDDMGSHYLGTACVYDSGQMPSSFAFIKTPSKSTTQTISVPVQLIDPANGNIRPWTETDNAEIAFPSSAEVKITLKGDFLNVNWVTNVGSAGSAKLPRSKASSKSSLTPIDTVRSWGEFKEFLQNLEHRRFIFRGQGNPHKLRTSFHRSGRADLRRYLAQDIPTLHRHLTSKTSHIFNLNDGDQNGAFLNLIQHHGYPTPLLDWTYSPYVAAWFAFSGRRNSEASASKENVRIFVFDRERWRDTFEQYALLLSHVPHFSLLEFIALDNNRLIPQQSISAVTNLDDVEEYLLRQSAEKGENFLQAIELPVHERPMIMQELSSMGITAGSLFPGLDGMCEELRERNFRL